jgi:hypothetical protein
LPSAVAAAEAQDERRVLRHESETSGIRTRVIRVSHGRTRSIQYFIGTV